MSTLTIPVRYSFNPRPLRDAMLNASPRLTNRQLAEDMGCHEVTICRVLKGHNASSEIIERLCARLGIPVHEVVTGPAD